MKYPRHGDVLEQVIALMQADDCGDMSLFLVGSTRPSKKRFFNSRLSDLDLLFLCQPQSLDEYSSCFTRINRLIKELDDVGDHIVEAFFSSASTVELYFSCLATIIGDDQLQDSDLIFGTASKDMKSDILPTVEVRRKLYIARATNFCRDYERLLPVADTEGARKVAKVLLRGLKLVVCAHTPVDELRTMEKKLFSVATLNDIVPILRSVCGQSLKIDSIFDEALSGKNIENWPAWMVVQDKVARQLLNVAPGQVMPVEDYRFFEAIVAVLHDMLIAGLKEILTDKNEENRQRLINEYANKAASLIVKLAMSGVIALYDFEHPMTPQVVKDSHGVIIEHLQGKDKGIASLSASVILLEYSLKQALIHANAHK